MLVFHHDHFVSVCAHSAHSTVDETCLKHTCVIASSSLIVSSSVARVQLPQFSFHEVSWRHDHTLPLWCQVLVALTSSSETKLRDATQGGSPICIKGINGMESREVSDAPWGVRFDRECFCCTTTAVFRLQFIVGRWQGRASTIGVLNCDYSVRS